ncbi:MAG: ABC transporter permease [Terriglobia bacterium]
MHRILAIVERDLRKFQRSPFLVFASLILPITQLVVLGYAFGGNLKNLKLGIVDQDHGISAIRIREMCQAVAANARTFTMIQYQNSHSALTDLRNGKINGILNIPPNFSRKDLVQDSPQVALIEDNTDNFVASTLDGTLTNLVSAYNDKQVDPRVSTGVTLETVEVYPYIPYIQYLLPGSIALAIFISAMIGGGIIFIDDKARGLHEGYLVTPITKTELVMGFNLAGAFKGFFAGLILTVCGSLIAGIQQPLDPFRLLKMTLLLAVTAVAFISMMFLMMVRINDPLVPRAIFGVLNTLLFFPSGAIYPINAFPKWMQMLAVVDPFTYAVHGFKTVLLKQTSLVAVSGDLIFLSVFSLIMMVSAAALFRRTL